VRQSLFFYYIQKQLYIFRHQLKTIFPSFVYFLILKCGEIYERQKIDVKIHIFQKMLNKTYRISFRIFAVSVAFTSIQKIRSYIKSVGLKVSSFFTPGNDSFYLTFLSNL
jgi:hypothetical protein